MFLYLVALGTLPGFECKVWRVLALDHKRKFDVVKFN